ncbi:hypothetical protein MHYP_G00094760 [Metynnis hypsauchen]
MNFKAGITLLFLCVLVIFHIEDCNACDLTATVGDSLEIPVKVPSPQNDEIKWIRNKEIILRRKKGKITFGKPENVNENGHFIIKNADMTHNGTYSVEVYNATTGILKTSKTAMLCVYEMLPKPVVNITCEKEKVVIKCEVQNNKGQIFIWYHRGEKTTQNEQTFRTHDVKNNDNLECEVEKPAKSPRSDAVSLVKCTSESKSEKKTLFGFDFRIMVGILAAGGVLVLVLMIVLVTCACQSCKRQEKRLRDEDEFRLNNFHLEIPNTPPQRSKNTARGQPAPPVPQEDPEVSNYEVDDPPPKAQSRAKNQQRIRPPPPPVDEDETPPPLPQPRKKAPNTKKNQGPLYMQP